MRRGLLVFVSSAACVIAVTWLAGCGNQTGSSTPVSCDYVRSPIALNARRALDFTPQEALDFSARDLEVPLTWTEQRAATVAPAVPGELQVSIDYEGGAVTEVDSEIPACDRMLEIEVAVDLRTPDGTFAERRNAKLSATSADRANIAVTIPMDEVDGELRLQPSAEGWSITRLTVLLHIAPDGTSGEIMAGSMRHDGGEHPTQVDADLAAGVFSLANWR